MDTYIHTQIVLDFKFNLDVVARKDKFKKQISVTQQKSYDSHTP